ncbi:hypothetical protein ABZ942_21960 [Nocardia sp. NPDC046473]|uniref:hypothetical protein n=1 Tax=Nocardia sp. NPDC046473 TaxID=3155733 RepID=UPI0033C66BDD
METIWTAHDDADLESEIAGWIPAATGYSGSVVANEGLVVRKPKTAATCADSIVLTGNQFYRTTATLQLSVSNVAVIVGVGTAAPRGGNTTVLVSTTRDLEVGDVVTCKSKASRNSPRTT